MHGTKRKLLGSALAAAATALAACGGDDADSSGGEPTSAANPETAVGPPKKCAARLIEVVDSEYMRERGVVAEQGQEALFRLARERVIADVCSSVPADASVAEAAEQAAEALRSEAD
jgi:hypothetical protein